MAASHGTQRRYVEGCRCDECKEAHRVSARGYRERRANGLTRPATVFAIPSGVVSEPAGPGPVELGAATEIGELAAEACPGLTQTALALARILDNPKAVSTQPAAARQLVAMLGMLSRRSHRRGKLGVVKSMTADG
jgi:hypothetical protein